jgi:RNA polymerase sigma-70 factor (ECF subfamily)
MTLVAECKIEGRTHDETVETVEATETPGSLDSLESLSARARNGDAVALDELLRRVRPLVYRWAWVQTADADEADDVTQAVLLRVHAGLVSFDGRAAFTTWLYRITGNACVELFRRRSAWRRLRERWADHMRKAPSTKSGRDELERIAGDGTAAIIRVMMQSLSANQRAAIDLVDLQGYEPIEAARMLDMNPVTMRTHLLRGRKAIRAAMLREGIDGIE